MNLSTWSTDTTSNIKKKKRQQHDRTRVKRESYEPLNDLCGNVLGTQISAKLYNCCNMHTATTLHTYKQGCRFQCEYIKRQRSRAAENNNNNQVNEELKKINNAHLFPVGVMCTH